MRSSVPWSCSLMCCASAAPQVVNSSGGMSVEDAYIAADCPGAHSPQGCCTTQHPQVGAAASTAAARYASCSGAVGRHRLREQAQGPGKHYFNPWRLQEAAGGASACGTFFSGRCGDALSYFCRARCCSTDQEVPHACTGIVALSSQHAALACVCCRERRC